MPWARTSPTTQAASSAATPEAKSTKNRVHLDFTTANRPGFVTGGARVISDDRAMGDIHWTALADPEDNDFYVA